MALEWRSDTFDTTFRQERLHISGRGLNPGETAKRVLAWFLFWEQGQDWDLTHISSAGAYSLTWIPNSLRPPPLYPLAAPDAPWAWWAPFVVRDTIMLQTMASTQDGFHFIDLDVNHRNTSGEIEFLYLSYEIPTEWTFFQQCTCAHRILVDTNTGATAVKLSNQPWETYLARHATEQTPPAE